VNGAISHLIIVGVTTECCVTTTLREANDRGNDSSISSWNNSNLITTGKGFECVLVSDATDGYIPEFKPVNLEMITFSDARLVVYPVSSLVSHLAPYRVYLAMYAIRVQF